MVQTAYRGHAVRRRNLLGQSWQEQMGAADDTGGPRTRRPQTPPPRDDEDAWRARRDEAGSLVFEHAVTGALQPSLPSEFDSWIEASDNALPSSVPFNPASSWRVAFTGPNRRGDMFFVQSTTDGDGPLKTRRDVPTEGCSGYAPA